MLPHLVVTASLLALTHAAAPGAAFSGSLSAQVPSATPEDEAVPGAQTRRRTSATSTGARGKANAPDSTGVGDRSSVKPVEPWKVTPLPAPPPAPAEEGRVEVAGAKIWWASYGPATPAAAEGGGETVILLHGGAGNSDHWSSQIAALTAAGLRVVAIDSRGHGRSTRDGRPFSYHLMAEDVLAVMDHLKLGQASIVGWSDGGIVGLDLAIHHPERVRKLVPFGANYSLAGLRGGGGPHATFATYFEKCAGDYQRLSATPREYKAFQAALKRMWKTEPGFRKEQLARIKAATLVAGGEHDEIIRQEHTREMAKLIPGARLLLIPDSSHFALWQKPEAFNQALIDFLAPASPAQPREAPPAAAR